MKETVFKKVVSVLLCAVMLIGVIPISSGAEGVSAELSAEEKQAVLTRSMGRWVFPVAEEFYDDIADFPGCRGGSQNTLYGGSFSGCISGDHEASGFGNDGLDIRANAGAEVYAPVDGLLYRSAFADATLGNVVIIEQKVTDEYSNYVILGHVGDGAPVASGSYVSAGETVAYAGGSPLHFAAVMAQAGRGEAIAADAWWELSLIEGNGWLTQPYGTGMLCVMPSSNTTSQYAGYITTAVTGPVDYGFVQPAPVEIPAEPAPHEHVWDAKVVNVEPTHLAAGEQTVVCSACGESRTESIPPLAEHTFSERNTADAYLVSAGSCDTPAVYAYSCICGERGSETFTAGDAAGHAWDGGTITTPPTHFAPGVRTYACTACGATRTEEVAASADHVFDQQNIADAYLVSAGSCDTPAVYAYSCICGERGSETFTAGDAAGHAWDGGTITTPPTHFAPGVRTYACTACGATRTEEVAASADHVFDQQNIADAYLVSAGSCDTPAVYAYSCICGERGSETFTAGSASGHSWNEGTITTPPTHFAPGVRTYTCTACGATRTEEVAADANHVFDQQNAADAYLVSGATCASPAVYVYSCVCGERGTETFTSGSASSEHSWNGGVVTVEPTHTAGGQKTYTCTVCSATRTEDIPASADQHVYDQRVVSDKYLKSGATCTSGAVYYYSCSCGAVGAETFVEGQAKGHTFATTHSFNETNHWFAPTCADNGNGEVGGFGEHTWDGGKITVQPGHAVNGEKQYTCTVCGATRKETVIGESHVYDQEKAEDKYLKTAATCTEPAVYFKSCTCGAVGTETFTSGAAKGHTFSKDWSKNENQHWQAATCAHTDQKTNVGDHIWDGGAVTVQPTATAKGERTFTCIVCKQTRKEALEPTTHTHTFDTRWTGNDSYHWHPATCEHTNEKTNFGEHVWDAGTVTVQATHTTKGEKVFTCTICGGKRKEAITETHVFDQQVASSAFLRTGASCTSAPTYYKSCVCGAKSNDFFTAGYAMGHSFSGSWSKDETYHWHACTVCGAKGEITSHYFNASNTCTTCGATKKDGHIHTSHLSRVPAKTSTCTQEGNIGYYVCDCGQWFTDVTATVAITDQQSVVTPAAGHVDKDKNGKCDICKERIATETEQYVMTEGSDSTWINTSSQGMVFRASLDYSKFDHVEVDGATISSLNYTVSSGSTIVELNVNYMKRLTVGQHTISIVGTDGRANASFSVKQGSANTEKKSGGSGLWIAVAIIAVLALVAAAVVAGYILYTGKSIIPKKKKNKGGKFAR